MVYQQVAAAHLHHMGQAMTRKLRLIRAVAVLGAGLVLAGCGPGAVDDIDQAGPAVAAAAPAITDEQYVDLVRSNVPFFANRPVTNLIDISDTVCKTLTGVVVTGDYRLPATYGQWKWLVTTMVQEGASGEQAGRMIAYAVGRGCPEKIPTYLPPSDADTGATG